MRLVLSALIAVVLLLEPSVAGAQEPGYMGAGQEIRPGGAPSSALLGVSPQDAVLGGAPTGQPTADTIRLSLAEAVSRGLKYNLAGLLGAQGIRSAEGARLLARSALLPNLSAGISESQAQINIKAYGFPTGPGVPYMFGPFSIFDGRFYLTQTIFDLKAINDAHAGSEQLEASRLSYQGVRDRVVLVCGQLYLRAVAGRSRIEAAHVQVQTAQTLYDLAVDRKKAGVAPAIEVLRAQVELQAQQQGLIVATNDLEKEKLDLARAIGLPLGQKYDLSDELRYAALPPFTLEEAVQLAYRDRSDYQSAQAQVRAAQYARKAAEATRLPSFHGTADYGVNGPGPTQIHGDYTVSASLRIPIFEAGKAKARILEADAVLKQQQAIAEDLRGKIHYEVQTAFLNIQAADESVRVATSSVELAKEQLNQAQDRFAAGVASNIEVVEAQEALARATESYISSLYAHNAAKASLAASLGAAESSFLKFVRGF
jgi:outer membrane protein TolC